MIAPTGSMRSCHLSSALLLLGVTVLDDVRRNHVVSHTHGELFQALKKVVGLSPLRMVWVVKLAIVLVLHWHTWGLSCDFNSTITGTSCYYHWDQIWWVWKRTRLVSTHELVCMWSFSVIKFILLSSFHNMTNDAVPLISLSAVGCLQGVTLSGDW